MDYELIDSGIGREGGEKLERFGAYVLRRPDPEVLWPKSLSADVWDSAHATFIRKGVAGHWEKRDTSMPDIWTVTLDGLTFHLHLGQAKHVGIFPEQIQHITWLQEKVSGAKILNLFAYTGLATSILAKAGAEVTHVDGNVTALDWAKKNCEANGISSVRFIEDDARKFVEREIKRGVKYDAVLLDPPVYGKAGKHVWHLEKDLLPLLENSKKLLSDKALFIAISGYASEYSHIAYKNALQSLFSQHEVRVNSGELYLEESKEGRQLPAGMYADAIFLR